MSPQSLRILPHKLPHLLRMPLLLLRHLSKITQTHNGPDLYATVRHLARHTLHNPNNLLQVCAV